MPIKAVWKIFYKNNWSVLVLFSVLAILLYFNSLTNPFHFDDYHHIVNNPSLRELKSIPRYIIDISTFSQRSDISHYRPLLLITYTLNYLIGGLNPVGYHIVNLVFHAGSSFLIFLILQAMLSNNEQIVVINQESEPRSQKLENKSVNYFAAMAGGLIFLVNPFNSEVINYITARSTVMCTFLYLFAFFCWVKYRQNSLSSEQTWVKTAHGSLFTTHYYIASLFLFLLAALTKEIAVTFPFIIWLYDSYPLLSGNASDKTIKPFTRRVKEYLPFIILILIPYIVVTLIFQLKKLERGVQAPLRPLWSHISTELTVMIDYMKLMVLPFRLSVYHDVPVYKTMYSLPVVFSGIMIIMVIAAAVIIRNRVKQAEWHLISFMILWFFIVLLPTTIVQLHLVLQENRGYIAAITFASLTAVVIGKAGKKYFHIPVVFLIIILMIYSFFTYQRNKVWRNDIELWSDVTGKYPNLDIAHINLAMAYRVKRDLPKSLEELQKAVSLNPKNYEGHLYLGWVYRDMGQYSKAFEELEYAVSIKPSEATLHNDLGAMYYEKKMFTLAEYHLQKASEIDTKYVSPRYNLALLYLYQRRFEDAVKKFTEVVSMDDTNQEAKQQLRMLLLRKTSN